MTIWNPIPDFLINLLHLTVNIGKTAIEIKEFTFGDLFFADLQIVKYVDFC